MLNSFEILLVVLVPLDEEALESSLVRGVCAAMIAFSLSREVCAVDHEIDVRSWWSEPSIDTCASSGRVSTGMK